MAILLRKRPVLTGIVGNPYYGPTGKPGFDATDSIILSWGIRASSFFYVVMGMTMLAHHADVPRMHLTRLFRSSQWWYIPGGIINREYRLWRKRLNTKIIRASKAVSLYDMLRKELRILHEGRILKFPLDPTQYNAFLVAWFSTARSPSEEEIRSYLDAR